jgi:hypothetical protein
MKTIKLADRIRHEFNNGTTIDEFPAGYLQLTLPDGRRCDAVPHETEEYRARAFALGYVREDGEIDIWAMCREHELLHGHIADVFKLPCSPALDRAAQGLTEANEISEAEEQLVLAWQRYRNVLKFHGVIPK